MGESYYREDIVVNPKEDLNIDRNIKRLIYNRLINPKKKTLILVCMSLNISERTLFRYLYDLFTLTEIKEISNQRDQLKLTPIGRTIINLTEEEFQEVKGKIKSGQKSWYINSKNKRSIVVDKEGILIEK